MNHDTSPLEHALDLAFFGPLGLALCAKDALPEWADTGRRRLFHQIDVARMVGEHATRHGQKLVAETLVGMGILPGRPPPLVKAPGTGPSAAPAPAAPPAPPARPVEVSYRPAVAPRSNNGHASGPSSGSAELAIPGYDSLSASQVVQRLAGLAPAELEAVRAYEASTRGRRTILTKVSQLQVGRS